MFCAGIALVAVVLVILAIRKAEYEPEGGSATQWHARRVTWQALVLLALLTYDCAFCLVMLTFASVGLTSDGLGTTQQVQITALAASHLLLGLGFIWQVWLHLRLIPLKQYSSLATDTSTCTMREEGRSSLMERFSQEGGKCREDSMHLSDGGYSEASLDQADFTKEGGSSSGLCHLCAYHPVTAMCNPCGHAVMCWGCAVRRIDSPRPVCPMCDASLTDIFECPNQDEAANV